MTYYFKKHPLSIITILIIFYLSFFTPPKTSLEEIKFIDKFVHFCMYGGLTLLIWLEHFHYHKKINKKKIIVEAIIFPMTMSGIIEILQGTCTTNRSGDVLDFVANCIGVITSSLICYYIVIPILRHRK